MTRVNPFLPPMIVVALVGLTLSYVTTAMTFDEGFYLSTARQVVENGLPLTRRVEDLRQTYLFQDSPPLLIYVAALSQVWFPGQDLPPRLVHILLFVVPTYLAVWRLTASRFGHWGATCALLAMLGSGQYLFFSPHVALDVPLGFFALVTLVTFDRACAAEGGSRWRWSLVAGVLLILATWSKYQAVCIAAATAASALLSPTNRVQFRRLLLPVAVIGVAGCVAVVTLLIYFTVFSDQRFLAETLEFNAGRMNYRGIDAVAMARAVLSTAGKIVSGAGGPLLVGAFSALSLQRRHRSLLVILTAYAVASLGFNLVFFRLPGSGSYYLNSAIPALVVLAGASGGAVLELVQSHTRGYAVGIISATIQFAGTPPPLFVPPYVNPHRAAAQYIATHSAPYQGVLATTYAVQFYSGNPVRIIVDSTPALLLASLDGTTPDIISFVVIDHGSIPIGAGPIAADWQRLLQERFTLAPVDAPGLAVYVRK